MGLVRRDDTSQGYGPGTYPCPHNLRTLANSLILNGAKLRRVRPQFEAGGVPLCGRAAPFIGRTERATAKMAQLDLKALAKKHIDQQPIDVLLYCIKRGVDAQACSNRGVMSVLRRHYRDARSGAMFLQRPAMGFPISKRVLRTLPRAYDPSPTTDHALSRADWST